MGRKQHDTQAKAEHKTHKGLTHYLSKVTHFLFKKSSKHEIEKDQSTIDNPEEIFGPYQEEANWLADILRASVTSLDRLGSPELDLYGSSLSLNEGYENIDPEMESPSPAPSSHASISTQPSKNSTSSKCSKGFSSMKKPAMTNATKDDSDIDPDILAQVQRYLEERIRESQLEEDSMIAITNGLGELAHLESASEA